MMDNPLWALFFWSLSLLKSAALHPKPSLPASSVALSNICFQPGARILPTLDPSHQLFDWFWLFLPVLNFLMILTFTFFFSFNFSLRLSLKMVPEFYLLSIHLINFLIDFDFLYPFSTSWWFWLSLSFSLLISHLHFHWKWSQNSSYSRSNSSTFLWIWTFSTHSHPSDNFDFHFIFLYKFVTYTFVENGPRILTNLDPSPQLWLILTFFLLIWCLNTTH